MPMEYWVAIEATTKTIIQRMIKGKVVVG